MIRPFWISVFVTLASGFCTNLTVLPLIVIWSETVIFTFAPAIVAASENRDRNSPMWFY